MARHQLALALTERPRWGGARRDAGRKRPPGIRPNVPHRPRVDLNRHSPALVTLRAGVDCLRRPAVFAALRAELASVASRDFNVAHFSVQSNHIHLLVEADDRKALSRGMHLLALRLARAVNRSLCRRGRVFTDRDHSRALRTPREARVALVYVLRNASKHVPGFRDLDPCSSAPSFDGWSWTGRLEGEGPVATSSARCWLLRVGWRRFGLIRPDEVPRNP
ncbi:MAG TPA: transposase [Candidatus Binatia bacterium]|nr:transposase [Candidatus Binatia bacterium]